MTGYKQIIKNMVEMEVTNYVEKKSGKAVEISSVKLTASDGFDCPVFEAEIMVGVGEILKRDFTIRGYVSEYGSVEVSSCSYERTHGYLGLNDDEVKTKKVFYFLVRDELDSFKFDR